MWNKLWNMHKNILWFVWKVVKPIMFVQTTMLTLAAATAYSGMYENSEDILNESKKGEFAVSRKGNIVPVPIPVSNPTLGTGLQAALLYMHPEDETAPEAPNATSGLAGMYTNTESWFAGAFHDGSLLNDKIQLSGVIGYGRLNLKFYGIGDMPILKDHPLKYGLESFVISPKVLFRLFDGKKWFAGINYLFLSSSFIQNQLQNLRHRTGCRGC